MYNKVPEMVKNYVQSAAEFTGLDNEVVTNSKPVKNFLRRLKVVDLDE